MKKLLVLFVILMVVAIPASSATWNYYKGTGADDWGAMPAVDPNGSWTITEPAGGTYGEYGVLWTNIATGLGDPATVSFDLNTINMPAIGRSSGEGDGGVWCEVFIMTLGGYGGDSNTAAGVMSGTYNSELVGKMTSVYVWNNYFGYGGGEWQTIYEWKNTPGGMHFLGFQSQTPAGGYKIDDTHTLSKSFEHSYGNIFIAVKTGVSNSGPNSSQGSVYGQSVTNLNVTTVPEPSSFLALGTGLMGLAGFVVRRRK